MVSAGMQLMKYLLFIFNFIFWVSGICSLVVGALVQGNYKYYLGFVGSRYLSVPILLIVVGCFVTVIALFGCYGAIKESHFLIVTFAVIIGVIFALELAAGIPPYVLRFDLEKTIEKNMRNGLKYYEGDNYTALTNSWDAVQQDFTCCGIHSPDDWENGSILSPFPPNIYPDSCCQKKTEGCGNNTEYPDRIFKQGCLDKMYNLCEKRKYQVGAVGFGIALIQVLSIVFACCLASAIRRKYAVLKKRLDD